MGEQPLPPYGACLLGSFNLVNYLIYKDDWYKFNVDQFKQDINVVVPAMDRIIDVATYPLEEQRVEAQTKRRMGLGVTGLADACHILGFPYGTKEMKEATHTIMKVLRDTVYQVSCRLAVERGPFEKLDVDNYLQSGFAQTLPESIRETIRSTGIRNSHLLSVAPTGTISLAADNVSSGIEPPYQIGNYSRKIRFGNGEVKDFVMSDYVSNSPYLTTKKQVCADDCDVNDHVDILNIVSSYVDSSVSKTCNVGDDVSFEDFCKIYEKAYYGGSSGCTTFRAAGFREGILTALDEEKEVSDQGSACFIDPETGQKTCE